MRPRQFPTVTEILAAAMIAAVVGGGDASAGERSSGTGQDMRLTDVHGKVIEEVLA